MAIPVQSLGSPLQLQASSQQLQDLLSGLKPGDQLSGRLVELLPEGKAILNLRGQNLVAQLPAGLQVLRGQILPLQVTQLAPADGGKAASLTLKLLPLEAAPQSLAPLASNPVSALSSAALSQAQLDQALNAARLASSPINVQVARTLAQLGVPLTPQALQSAVQAVNSLLAAERPAPPPPAPTALPPTSAEALQNALVQLRVAAQISPPGPAALVLQQAVREVQASLQGPPNPVPASTPPSNATVAPATPAAIALSTGLPASTALASTPAPAALPSTPSAPSAPLPSSPAAPPPAHIAALNAVQQAVSQLLAQPQAASLQPLQAALQSLSATVTPAPGPSATNPGATQLTQTPAPAGSVPTTPASATGPATTTTPAAAPIPAPSTTPGPPLTASVPTAPNAPLVVTPPASAANSASPVDPTIALVQRESVAPLQTALTQAPAPTVQTLQQALALQSEALQSAASLPAQRLVQAVQVQFPQAQPEAVLQSARQTLAQLQAALSPLPPSQPLSLPLLQNLLDQAGIAAPRVPLQSLPVETVAAAVAWLQARDLPPQRPLVEAVAVFMQQDHNALPAAQRALSQAATLSPELLAQRPALATAVQNAQQALSQASLQPETPALAGRLQAWAAQQGLNLEAALAGNGEAFRNEATPIVVPSQQGLRPALQNLEQQLRLALQDPLARQPEIAAPIQNALAEAQNAGRALSAVPLQAQGAPAYDTVHMPLPVLMGADLGGQLSVTWRHGRDRQLDDKEPVNVAVALNTGSLGPIKVLLQVWKGSASARVLAQDAATADFLAAGAEELRAGFAERTPFDLQALSFATDTPTPRGSASAGPPVSAEGWSA